MSEPILGSQQELRNDFRMLLDEGLFADARLICFEQKFGDDGNERGEMEGERKRVEISVHRAILSARSKFFADAFADGRDELEIQEFPASVVQAIISHIYGDFISGVEKLDDRMLISLYKAAQLYSLDIFETQKVQTEIVINHFPLKFANNYERNQNAKIKSEFWTNYDRSFRSGSLFACSKPWKMELKMALRDKNKHKGTKKMHIDFTLDSEAFPLQTLVTDLSLSVLDSIGGENLKTITRKFFSVGGTKTVWKDCLNYSQIVNKKWFRRGEEFDTVSGRSFSHPKLIVRCEATVRYVAKKNTKEKDNRKKSDFTVLFESGRFSDARIVCFDLMKKRISIPVHRCVLAARSKFFAAAFSVDMREAEMGEIVVPTETGFSLATVWTMLHFVYTASIPLFLDESKLIPLFKAGHFYQIDGLMDSCVELFQMSIENCTDWLSMGDFYGSLTLKKKALQFLKRNPKEVKATAGWLCLMEESEGVSEELKTLCKHWLGELSVTLENCCEVHRDSVQYDNWELQKRVEAFIRVHREAVKASEGWRRLMESEGHEESKSLIAIELMESDSDSSSSDTDSSTDYSFDSDDSD